MRLKLPSGCTCNAKRYSFSLNARNAKRYSFSLNGKTLQFFTQWQNVTVFHSMHATRACPTLYCLNLHPHMAAAAVSSMAACPQAVFTSCQSAADVCGGAVPIKLLRKNNGDVCGGAVPILKPLMVVNGELPLSPGMMRKQSLRTWVRRRTCANCYEKTMGEGC